MENLERCERVHEYNESERCDFVRNNKDCQCAEGFFNYINFIYCYYDDENIVQALSIYGIWSCFLFTVLGLTADKFFCPSLTVIAKSMRLSQNVAGVTFLAFGNGASDIFASLAAAAQNRPELVISGLFGAGIFVTCAVSGAIMVATPFKIKEEPFLRDIIFYLIAAYWAFYVYYYGRVRAIDAFGFLILYGIYIVVVLLVPYFYKKLYGDDIEENGERIDDHLPTHYTQKDNLMVGFEKDLDETSPLLKISRQKVDDVGRFRTCLNVLSPIDSEKWKRAKWYVRVLFALKAPAILVLKMTIPLIDYDAPNHSWSQVLNAFHCVVGPPFLFVAMQTSMVTVVGFCPLWVIVLFIGIVAGVLVLCTSSHPQPPAYHAAFGYLGFAISIVWIYIMANEIVNVLTVMGIVLNINDAILGLTILAWGNSVGDFIANFSVARKGSPMMGISACYGGPVFNLLVGMGLPFTIETFRRQNHIKLIYDPSVTIMSAFLFTSLVSTLVVMLVTGFHVRRYYGFYLLFLYVAFVGCAIFNAVQS